MFSTKILFLAVCLGVPVFSLSQGLIIAEPLGPDSSKALTGPPRLRQGEKVRVEVRNVNTMLYSVRINATYRPIPLGNKTDLTGNWSAPAAPAVGAAAVRDLRDVLDARDNILKEIIENDKTFREQGGAYKHPQLVVREHLDALAKKLNVNSQPLGEITPTTIVKTALAFEQPPTPRLIRAADDLVQLYEAARRVDLNTILDVPMQAGNDLSVIVEVNPRAEVSDPDGRPLRFDLDNHVYAFADKPGSYVSDPVVIELDGVDRSPWSAAVFFSSERDESYANSGGTILKRGARDDAGVYVGTLYHFEAFGANNNVVISMGLGTSGAKLMYFVGPSYRMGPPNARGYISFGLALSNVTRLDGANVGDAIAADATVPTKQVFRKGYGVCLSYRF
jgi:hypothetical protein